MLTSVLTVGTTAVVTGTLAGRLGPDRCGGHMLARRMVNLVSPFCRTEAGHRTEAGQVLLHGGASAILERTQLGS